MMELSRADQARNRRYEVARDYLTSVGVRVLDQEWKNPEGMLELVATERNELVVVVLQDTGSTHVPPASTLKRQRRMAVAWMSAHAVSFPRVRVDVVSVRLLPVGQSNLEHLRSADGDLY